VSSDLSAVGARRSRRSASASAPDGRSTRMGRRPHERPGRRWGVMTQAVRHVLLLADRITNADQAGTVRAYVERLGRRGLEPRVPCAAWLGPRRDGLDVEEHRGLGDRWRLPWALRGLRRPEGPWRPALIHAFQVRMAPAALELAERWGIPYLQGVEEFLPP